MNNEKRQLKPYHGIILFVLVILTFLFVAFPIQEKFGLYGVLLTELIILALAVIPAILLKADLKEVFPVKVPKLRHILGVIVLWIGGLIIVTLVTMILAYFFPEGLLEVSSSLQTVFTSIPAVISFLIVAGSPAICEEALMRGFILSSFKSLKNRWLIVFLMGVIFGVFHLDSYRFLPTAILGAFLTYIMIETKNILLPALYHFINNGFSTVVSFISSASDVNAGGQMYLPLASIGVYLLLAAAAPFIILLGAWLLHDKKEKVGQEGLPYIDPAEKAKEKKNRLIRVLTATGLTVVLFVAGFVITIIGSFDMLKPVIQSELSYDINKDTENEIIPFEIQLAGTYVVDYEIENERGLIDVRIMNEEGEELYQFSCLNMSSNGNEMQLTPGKYQVVIDFVMEDIEEYHEKMGYDFDESTRETYNLTGDLTQMTPFRFKMTMQNKLLQY
jgi:membrane protease YdiL (CAAX protease family)